MLNFWRHIVVIVLGLAVAPADAQTLSNTPKTFVAVTLGPDWDDAYSDSTRVRGATWRSGFAFGFDWGRSGVEFDVGVPQWHVKNLGPHPYQYVGPSFGFEQQGHFYESSSTVRRRSIDLTVSYRANVPVNRHVTFTWLAGGGYVFRPEQFTSVTKEVLPDGQRTEAKTDRGTASRNYLAATGGLDVEFRVAPQVSVVPRLRVTAFPSLLDDSGLAPRMLMGRPEISVRWAILTRVGSDFRRRRLHPFRGNPRLHRRGFATKAAAIASTNAFAPLSSSCARNLRAIARRSTTSQA